MTWNRLSDIDIKFQDYSTSTSHDNPGLQLVVEKKYTEKYMALKVFEKICLQNPISGSEVPRKNIWL